MRKKRPEGKRLELKLDKVFSELVRRRSGGVCAMWKIKPDTCKSPHNDWKYGMDCSHTAYGRRRKSLRYDFDNCDALCKGCHRKVEESALLAHEFKYEQLGSEGIRRLTTKSNLLVKRTVDDKKELLSYLQKELDLEYENDFNYGE